MLSVVKIVWLLFGCLRWETETGCTQVCYLGSACLLSHLSLSAVTCLSFTFDQSLLWLWLELKLFNTATVKRCNFLTSNCVSLRSAGALQKTNALFAYSSTTSVPTRTPQDDKLWLDWYHLKQTKLLLSGQLNCMEWGCYWEAKVACLQVLNTSWQCNIQYDGALEGLILSHFKP